jgi:hypothetical protein
MKSLNNELLTKKWNNMVDIVFEHKYVNAILRFNGNTKYFAVKRQINREISKKTLP